MSEVTTARGGLFGKMMTGNTEERPGIRSNSNSLTSSDTLVDLRTELTPKRPEIEEG